MAEIGFYHLTSSPLERALPKLLERARAQGHPIVVRAGSAERVAELDAILWTYDEASFLAHGSARDGNPAAQPIWLTHQPENPNGASILFLVDGVEADDLAGYTRCIDMFDGNNPDAVVAARGRWRAATAAGHTLTYWQQTEKGWEKKA
jgi:DNA polymerase-3 subunit chi